MKNVLRRTFTNGKNIVITYYIQNSIRYIISGLFSQYKMKKLMSNVQNRSDYNSIIKRVHYYNKLTDKQALSSFRIQLKDFKLGSKKLKERGSFGSKYFFDTYEHTKYFDKDLSFDYLFGDVTSVLETPTIVKSRPIGDENKNSILMNLDKLRHFIFIDDTIPFEKKENKAIFLSYTRYKPHRIDFMEKFHGSSVCLCGDVDTQTLTPEWYHRKISIWAHLRYKFILTIEGNDVASNLKWVMSSNSIAVMPKPKYETWFMEGQLIANHHYIEIKSDYSDFEEKIAYYSEHLDESEQIIKNAHEYIHQFKNKDRERIISYMVLEKFLSSVN